MPILLRSPWTSQPQYPLRRSKTLGRGLIAYGTGSVPQDWTYVRGGPGTKQTIYGLSSSFVASSAQYLTKDVAVSTPLTLFALARPTAVNSNQGVISVGATTDNAHLLYIGSNAGIQMFSTSNGNAFQASSPPAVLTANTFYSFVGRVSAPNSRQVFLDGVQVGTDTNTVAPAVSSTCAVAAYWNSGGEVPSFFFDGDTAVWGVWDRALADEEIKALYINPWQIFNIRNIFLPVGAAAVITYTMSNATFVPGSITATGVQAQVDLTVA
jgi:hypothetical protein